MEYTLRPRSVSLTAFRGGCCVWASTCLNTSQRYIFGYANPIHSINNILTLTPTGFSAITTSLLLGVRHFLFSSSLTPHSTGALHIPRRKTQSIRKPPVGAGVPIFTHICLVVVSKYAKGLYRVVNYCFILSLAQRWVAKDRLSRFGRLRLRLSLLQVLPSASAAPLYWGR